MASIKHATCVPNPLTSDDALFSVRVGACSGEQAASNLQVSLASLVHSFVSVPRHEALVALLREACNLFAPPLQRRVLPAHVSTR